MNCVHVHMIFFFFRTSLSLFAVTSNSYLSHSLLSHIHVQFFCFCSYSVLCSQFCAKFDRTNGSMPTDRNVYAGIHNFTMPGDVAVYILWYR